MSCMLSHDHGMLLQEQEAADFAAGLAAGCAAGHQSRQHKRAPAEDVEWRYLEVCTAVTHGFGPCDMHGSSQCG